MARDLSLTAAASSEDTMADSDVSSGHHVRLSYAAFQGILGVRRIEHSNDRLARGIQKLACAFHNINEWLQERCKGSRKWK